MAESFLNIPRFKEITPFYYFVIFFGLLLSEYQSLTNVYFEVTFILYLSFPPLSNIIITRHSNIFFSPSGRVPYHCYSMLGNQASRATIIHLCRPQCVGTTAITVNSLGSHTADCVWLTRSAEENEVETHSANKLACLNKITGVSGEEK